MQQNAKHSATQAALATGRTAAKTPRWFEAARDVVRAWTPYGFAVCKDGNRKQLSEQFRSKSDDKRFDYYGHDYYHHDKYYNCYYYYH